MHAPILYLTHSGLFLLSKKLYFFHLSACFLALSYVTKKELKPDIKSHELWLASKGLLSTSSSEICKCNLRISSCRVSSNFEALHLKNLNTNCLRWLFIVFSRLTHVYSSLESEDDRSFHLFKRIYDGKNLVSMHSTFTTFPYAWKKKKQATAILTIKRDFSVNTIEIPISRWRSFDAKVPWDFTLKTLHSFGMTTPTNDPTIPDLVLIQFLSGVFCISTAVVATTQ